MATAATPAGPTARPGPAWTRYLDRAHAHEALIEWREHEGILRIRETSPHAPDARWEETTHTQLAWEARVAAWLLECRLSLLGAYWRQSSTDPAWRALGTPAGAPTPDPRANFVIKAQHAPLLHHYHDPRGGGDTLIAALRAEGNRFAVVRAQLDVPSLDIGRIDLRHARLPDVMTKSLVLREQFALTQAGLPKLVTRDDYVRAFGAAGEKRAASLVDQVLARVREDRLERPAPRLDESDIYAEFLMTVNDPRLIALHKRFLRPEQEEALLNGGPPLIHKAIAQMRAGVDHASQHLLTILEASLLARERMRSGKLVRSDPEVRALTRLAYYL